MYIHLFVFGIQQPARILNHRVKTVGDPDVRYREGVKSKLFQLLAYLFQQGIHKPVHNCFLWIILCYDLDQVDLISLADDGDGESLREVFV